MTGFDLDGLTDAVRPDRQAEIAAGVAALRVECEIHRPRIRITSDGAVDSHGAAALLDRSEKVLRNWRAPSCDLASWKRITGRKIGGRVTYLLTEIAEWRLDNAEK